MIDGASAPTYKDATAALNICARVGLNTTSDVAVVRDWAAAAFDMMAMGSYPYPSSYMLNGNGELPAFPVRVACELLMRSLPDAPEECRGFASCRQKAGEFRGTFTKVSRWELRSLRSEQEAGERTGPPCRHERKRHGNATAEELLRGLAAAVGVWYNYTGGPLADGRKDVHENRHLHALQCVRLIFAS